MTIFDRIEECLVDYDLKAKDLANAIGVGTSAFAQWKKRGTVPEPAMLYAIAKYLTVSTHWLLFGELDDCWTESTYQDRLGLSPECIVYRIENQIESLTQNFSKKYDEKFYELIIDIVSVRELYNWKNRRLNPSFVKLLKIADKLKVHYEWILTGNEPDAKYTDSWLVRIVQDYPYMLRSFTCLSSEDKNVAMKTIDSLFLAEQYRKDKFNKNY